MENLFNYLYIFILLILIIYIIYCVFFSKDSFTKSNIEKYSPIINRQNIIKKDNNTCVKPFIVSEDKKRNTTCSKDKYIHQHGNRMLTSPDKYIDMILQVLKDLSKKNIDVLSIKDSDLIEIDYLEDKSSIIDFYNDQLHKLCKEKEYLQNNGAWKYEQFYISEPTIFLYKVKDQKFMVMKVYYTLGNPMRSSYTNCYGFLTIENNKIESQYNNIVSMTESNNIDTFNNIANKPNEEFSDLKDDKLEYSFLNTMPKLKFNQWGSEISKSSINYIAEYHDGEEIDIKAEIPNEFKLNKDSVPDTFKPQQLPPLFGNGICDYPPEYTIDNKKVLVDSPPILY